ncbi:unnamed protein product, partial [marine sediment metagenome]
CAYAYNSVQAKLATKQKAARAFKQAADFGRSRSVVLRNKFDYRIYCRRRIKTDIEEEKDG